MRIAFFSPLPPAKSGIADYSAALLEELSRLAPVDIHTSSEAFQPDSSTLPLYQIGNNGHHDFCYRAALAHPGVIVLHEANLHHLVVDLTIARGDWDAYLREVSFDGGPAARDYATRYVIPRLRGPDYDGVPMLRRLLANARGVIVHSAFVEDEARRAGFSGPIARIPHGAWIPAVDGAPMRARLGLDPDTPVIGIFGFLKPYKRIAESLRAFARLVRRNPSVRLILAGEPHPELPLDSLIASLDLQPFVRSLGFLPIDDFVSAIAACDIVLNLRHPTVGENSGTLMRSLGLGKAVIVSDNGSFRELPEDICLKAPVDASEEDFLFEYLNLLTSQPAVARALGARAQQWVQSECNWASVARRYLEFLSAVHSGAALAAPVAPVAAPSAAPTEVPAHLPVESPEAAYLLSWAKNEESLRYLRQHLSRLLKTLALTPPGGPSDRILEMGAYLQITPALQFRLGYGEVRGCYFGPSGLTECRSARSSSGEEFSCDIDLFDAEKDPFPYPDASFSTILCCELLEHLAADPMHMMSEINRILKPGGHLVLTTPNAASLRALDAILNLHHPGFFQAYIRPVPDGEPEARHNREYAPPEISLLLEDSGFEIALLETGEFADAPHPEHAWIVHLLNRYQCPATLRGDDIFAVGRKVSAIRSRFPAWLYQ